MVKSKPLGPKTLGLGREPYRRLSKDDLFADAEDLEDRPTFMGRVVVDFTQYRAVRCDPFSSPFIGQKNLGNFTVSDLFSPEASIVHGDQCSRDEQGRNWLHLCSNWRHKFQFEPVRLEGRENHVAD